MRFYVAFNKYKFYRTISVEGSGTSQNLLISSPKFWKKEKWWILFKSVNW